MLSDTKNLEMEVSDSMMLYNSSDEQNAIVLKMDFTTGEYTTDFYMYENEPLTLRQEVILSVYTSMAVMGVLFNLLTLVIVGLGVNISKEVKIQLINLAVADLLMSLLVPAKNASSLLTTVSFPDSIHLCRLYLFVRHAAQYVSLLCNAAICLERFVVIFFPFRATKYSRTHKMIVIAVIWLCASLPGVTSIVRAELLGFEGMRECNVMRPILPYKLEVWLKALQYLLPATIIVLIYSAIYIKLCLKRATGVRRHLSSQWKKELHKVMYF